MTADEYVEQILKKYEVQRGASSLPEQFGAAVEKPLRQWAGNYLNLLKYSGSYAKQTGVHGTSDVDIFISLKSNTPESLEQVYSLLANMARENKWSPRLQNVSVGVTVNGIQGDLVPAKVQEGSRNYHSLYIRKRNSWTQTNIDLHIDNVLNSGRLKEIRAIKIWRMINGLDFPSLYLELFTIQSLSNKSKSTLAANVLHVLREISSSITSTQIVDPSNTNNILSNELTLDEKKAIAAKAKISADQQNWGTIIW